jgi:translation initiation factor 2B subunit (eIF-2B alpha/beta/delta family)
MNKQKRFNQICNDIKSIKIQGAENIAKSAFFAYKLIPTENSKRKLISLRPTEPMLQNVLHFADKMSYIELVKKLDDSQLKINQEVFKIIQNNSIIFTHCHSSTLIKSLIYAKIKGKKFEVYNTETRPLFQGRKTYQELKKAGIKTTMFIDSASEIALTKEQDKEEKTHPVNMIFLGADAITKKGVINKVGSGMISEIARKNKIPLYIISNSLKFSNKYLSFEQRNGNEVWKRKKANIKNPSFELVSKENITGIMSELGNLSYNKFLKKVKD